MESSTPDLVRRALAGDRQAMRQLFAHVICPVIEGRLARGLALSGAGRQELRDRVQEVIVHLLDRDAAVLRRWDPQRGALEAYVATVAENLTTSRLRKKPPPLPTEDLDSEAGASATPEEGAAFSHLVRRLLREMNDDEGALFHAVYMEELSPAEAATRLGIKRDAVYKRIERLRERLAEMLSNPKKPAT